MGASNFETMCFGKDVREAYRAAVEDAQWESGHDSYNGTISTTSGFMEIPPNGRRLSTIIQQGLQHGSGIEKWGRCGAVIIKGTDAKDYRERHHLVGKKGVVVLFFGWAAE